MKTRLTARAVRIFDDKTILKILVRVIRENETLCSNLKEVNRFLQDHIVAFLAANSFGVAYLIQNIISEAVQPECPLYEEDLKILQEHYEENVRQLETRISSAIFHM